MSLPFGNGLIRLHHPDSHLTTRSLRHRVRPRRLSAAYTGHRATNLQHSANVAHRVSLPTTVSGVPWLNLCVVQMQHHILVHLLCVHHSHRYRHKHRVHDSAMVANHRTSTHWILRLVGFLFVLVAQWHVHSQSKPGVQEDGQRPGLRRRGDQDFVVGVHLHLLVSAHGGRHFGEWRLGFHALLVAVWAVFNCRLAHQFLVHSVVV
mmetsp:Transcript_5003/g.8470  ORF Transcript_5003/g.8470 Transcript_5003/m.8470 type:complete len:206 (-) Transcript_5003:147-764(-)